MNDKRVGRIGNEIKKVISNLLNSDLKDPRLMMMISLSDVRVSRDLSQAEIFVTILGNDDEKMKALEGLTSAKGYIKKELGRSLELRHIPELIFKLDESIEHGIYMSKLIDEVKRQDEERRTKSDE